MAITNGYATLEELQQKLARDSDERDKKIDLLEVSIERASRIIDNLADRVFYTVSLSSETLDAYGLSDNKLFISHGLKRIYANAPIISISSITSSGTTLTENSDYYVYKEDGYIENSSYWTTARKAIVISGSIGYATTPPYVKEWCLTIAEVLSGLGMRSVIGADGDEIAVIKNSIPAWVIEDIERKRMQYV